MPETAVRVIIRGRVQGVWYRAWTEGEARGRGLDGWVRNCADGSVEALFCGPEETVREMIARCYRGPPAARVEEIEEFPAEKPSVSGFLVTR